MLNPITATADILGADEAQSIDTAFRRLTSATVEMERLQRELEGLYDRERQRAEEDGLDAGIQAGLQILADIDTTTTSFFQSIEREIALLSIAVAERIVGQYDEREQVLRAACQAVRELGPEDPATLYVSAGYFSELAARLKEMQPNERKPVPYIIQADPRLNAGDCRLETARGVIDANVARQFDTLRRAILAWGTAENARKSENEGAGNAANAERG